jgi:hypothetical protein
VGAVNTAFEIWTKSGGVLKAATSLASLFSPNRSCLPNISDPGVQYDAASDHFVLEALTYDSSYDSVICMAVSMTGDPTGSYWVYAFAVSPAADLLDFPQFAIGSDAVYLSGNQYQNGATFIGARVYAYNRSQLEAGQPTSYLSHDVGNDAAGLPADTLYPAKGVSVANTAYFLGADNNAATGSSISLWKWSDPFGANVFTLQGGITVTGYAQPPKATEPGGSTVDTNDVRDLGAAYYAGTVYGVHAIGCNPGGGTVDCVQWYQLGNLDGAPSLIQQGIVGGSGQNRYFPNLSVDKAGDMLLGYAYSSGSDYPGVRYTGRLATDPLGTVEAESVLKTGQGFINGGRYGDYAGEQLDPDGCTVWHLEEYAKSGVLWGTWVGNMKFDGCSQPDYSLAASPTSQTVAPGQPTSYAVTVNPVGGFTGSVNLTVSGLPSGASGSFSPNPTTSTSTLSVTTATSTPAGSYVLTVTGTSGQLTHTTQVTLVVTQPDFSLSASPSSRTVTQGQGSTYTVTVTPSGGFSNGVTLSVSGLPSGANGTFNPNPATTTSTLTVTTSSSTPTGSFPLKITGTSGSLTHQATLTLVVQPVGTFTLSPSPTSATAHRGGSGATYTVTIQPSSGFNGSVNLSVSGLPPRTSASFSPNPATSTSTLTVTASRRATPGQYTLKITGTSGSLTTTTTVTLTIS